MDKVTSTNLERWLNSPAVSSSDKDIISKMSDNERDDAFYKQIEFGTAGMRGVLGPGTNRLNAFTVKRAALAFATALLNQYGDEAKKRGIVISHDNRHFSREFSLESAEIFNLLGIKAYLFDSLRPTPELSFAVRYLKCVGGVMITASHNPKEYNGYKVYDETGCQLTPDLIQPVLEEVAKYPDELNVTFKEAEKKGETVILGPEVDDEYVRLCKGIQINPDLPKEGFKIVYTPQHGTSYENAMRVFKELGYEIIPVEKQCTHDPDFGGTKSPNPEEPVAYEEAIKLAKEVKAELVVMTDPDGDRVGLAYKDKEGEYRLFTGNQSAALLQDYIYGELSRKGKLPKDGIMYDTVVTSDLGRKIAKSYGLRNDSFLTGFKYIGSAIAESEREHLPGTFVFGYEESYGCLIAPFVRDKDGIQAILLYCEMALWHYLGKTTLDVAYDGLMERYGYHYAKTASATFKGSEGSAKMAEIMGKLHENPPSTLGGLKVLRIEDYEKGYALEGGKKETLTLPKSNMVRLMLEGGSWVAVRPSGTEPKIKFYVELVTKEKQPEGEATRFADSLKKEFGAD